MDDEQWTHRIALSMLKGIGPVNARKLMAYCGGVDPLFTDARVQRSLERVPGIGPVLAASVRDRSVLRAAAKELVVVRERGYRMFFCTDADFPKRLQQCEDAPVLLYMEGGADPGVARSLAVVGTRSPSDHGKRFCAELVAGLAEAGVTIVSGLAYGVDIVAHRSALEHGLPTIACVAHGLDRVYPAEHSATARAICAAGGALVTELPTGSRFAPGNFPARNRVIAGLSDATLVVESGPRGGSLITADIANSYDREVMAVPGRPGDARSVGCNKLVQDSKAHLVLGAEDVLRLMDWLPGKRPRAAQQTSMFNDLPPEEQALMDVIRARGKVDIDTLCTEAKVPAQRAVALLLGLEFSGAVRALPGRIYTPG